MKVRLLSLNAGLLQLLGRSTPAPYVPERLIALPAELRKMKADVVVLQEVYGSSRRRWLAEALKDIYPFAIYPRKRRFLGLENGLMTLSRYPASGYLELFADAPIDEALFDSKGLLVTGHQLPKALSLNIVNLHTTAGGMLQLPEHESINLIRSRQVTQILVRTASLSSPVIIVGDLNAGPGVSEINFRQVTEAGFVSAHDFIHGQSSEATWDPANPLNANGPHKVCPPQRIDHFFIRGTDLAENRLKPLSSTICLKDSVVPIPGRTAVTVSDHFGLFVEIEVSVELSGLGGSTSA